MRILPVIVVVLALLALATSAFAHTGPLVNGEPVDNQLTLSVDPITTTHDETINNPNNYYKGWWFVTLTNSGPAAWTGVTIAPGVGSLVSLVEGNNLPDEWGFTANSISVNRPATVNYYGSLGDGSRTYENGAVGILHASASVSFASAVAAGQKVSFRVYTDNSWYQGPYASSFQLTITPVVPEPSSLAALAGGLVGLAGLVRRKRS